MYAQKKWRFFCFNVEDTWSSWLKAQPMVWRAQVASVLSSLILPRVLGLGVGRPGPMLCGRLAAGLESCCVNCPRLSPPGSEAASAGPGEVLLCCI